VEKDGLAAARPSFEARRFAENARGSARALLAIGSWSLPCGAARLRVAAPHQVAEA
jgi:hypothetical protein